MKLLRLLVIGLACLGPALAMAQWQWVEKDGRKVFSDRPPPPDIPAKSILKQPGGRAVQADPAVAAASAPTAAAAAAAGAASAAAQAAASVPRISGKDPALEEKRRAAAAAEADKRKAEDDRQAALRADNCARAKRGKATLDTGARLATVNDKGEREIMSDTQRAAETKRLQAILDNDCKGS